MHRVRSTVAWLGFFIAFAPVAVQSANGLPPNWQLTGKNASSYSVDVQDKTLQLSSAAAGDGFGTAMQMIDSAHYAGKAVRFSADVRSEGVDGWAGLWIRVDGGAGKVLAFDSMQNRAIKGTTAWKNYEVVVPVDGTATRIAFGLLLSGNGSVWMKNLAFAPAAAAPAAPLASPPLPMEPNLDLTP